MSRIELLRFFSYDWLFPDETESESDGTSDAATPRVTSGVDALEMFLGQTGLQTGMRLLRLGSFTATNETTPTQTPADFDLDMIQGVAGNLNVTPEFRREVAAMAARLGTRPEYIMAVMSFETGGTFSPSKQNPSTHATGLIHFMPATAQGMLAEDGVDVTPARAREIFAAMTPLEQLPYVERYLAQRKFQGRLGTLEGVYTAVLSGRARSNGDDVVFGPGVNYNANSGLDWNGDGQITAAEATNPVAFRLFGGVTRVQTRLRELGYYERKPDGQYGPLTRAALERFQGDSQLPVTGLMDEQTGRALFDLQAAQTDATATNDLRRGANGPEVERLQDQLVALGHLTAAEKNTGPGVFGRRTENALKSFQQRNGLEPTGVLDAATYRKLHALDAVPNSTRAGGDHFTVEDGVVLSDNARERIGRIADEYFRRTGKNLRVTDGTRTAHDQARQIYNKIQLNDTGIYRDQTSLAEIRRAYDAGVRAHKSRAQIVNDMAAVIQAQVDRGVYISRHLRAGAVDVSVRGMTAADEREFRASVAAVGGTEVLRETRPPHFHLQF